jgi:NAD-dependent SIR2 family protein deacetylase
MDALVEESMLSNEERKCLKCGASLSEEDVMKIKNEDGSWETIPLPVCPDCFVKEMRERKHIKQKRI